MRMENGKRKITKVYIYCLLIGIGAALTAIAYYEKKVIPSKVEEIELSAQRSELFNSWIESKFRLQHQLADDEDVNQAIETMFALWISGDSNLKELTNHILPESAHGKNLERILIASLERDDPLGIKKYGEIRIEEDAQFIGFYTNDSKGCGIRLKLMRKLKSITHNAEYCELAMKFRNDVGDFSKADHSPVQNRAVR